jgi:citrate lyase subunit beta/citryl-CoA lyase
LPRPFVKVEPAAAILRALSHPDDDTDLAPRTPRAALFVPASSRERHARAFASGADAVILDLEDGVAPALKAEARAGLREALAERVEGCRAVVRINAPATAAGAADLEELAGLDADAVMVPKADPDSVALAAGAGIPIVALVETAAGVLAAERTAAHPAVALLMLGPVDLAAELGCEESADGDELLLARGQLLLASAAAGLPAPLDGPCLQTRDAAVLELELRRAKRLGFGGKACIHPAQVEATTRAFSPSAEEVEWARRVLAGFEQGIERDEGVTVVDGQMVDLPVVTRARRILALA